MKKRAYFILGVLIAFGMLIYGANLYTYEKSKYSRIRGTTSVQLLPSSWHLVGNKSISDASVTLEPNVLINNNTLKITFDLHGLCARPGPASSVDLVSGKKIFSISISDYAENCKNGEQSIDTPLSHFIGYDSKIIIDSINISFWDPTIYSVDISSIIAYNAGSSVLGISTDPKIKNLKKTFPQITPLRPSPYAAESLPE